MKLSTLLILGFLVGCSGAPDGGPETSTGGGNPSDPDGLYDSPSHQGSGGSCGNASVQIMSLNLPDGDVAVVTVPIPCNLSWIDKGDPPPDRVRKRVVDPPPNKIIIRQKEKFTR